MCRIVVEVFGETTQVTEAEVVMDTGRGMRLTYMLRSRIVSGSSLTLSVRGHIQRENETILKFAED